MGKGRAGFLDEKAMLKQMQADDACLTAKVGDELVEEGTLDEEAREMHGPGRGERAEIRTTEGDEYSYEEATNCRLRDETDASMVFGRGTAGAPVNVDEVKVSVHGKSSSGAKELRKKTPVKQVAPFDY